MQNLPVYLYQNNLDIILDLDPTTRGVNNVMYQRDLQIQKGVKNVVRIQFKNSDQKRIIVSNTGTYLFTMFDAINQRQILEKPINILDDGVTHSLRGEGEVVFGESDTIDLEVSEYQFSVKYLDPALGGYVPAYSNTYYGVAGKIKVLNDIYPVLKPSQSVSDFQQTYNDSIQLYQWNSGNIYASPEYHSTGAALHTMALYMTNFKGTVYVQGTLFSSPGSSGRYVTISTLTYDGFSGIDYLNFNGVFSFVRVIYQPAKGPMNYDNLSTAYAGTFDKVLYRS